MKLCSITVRILIVTYKRMHRCFFTRVTRHLKDLQMLVTDLIVKVKCIQEMKRSILYVTRSIIF